MCPVFTLVASPNHAREVMICQCKAHGGWDASPLMMASRMVGEQESHSAFGGLAPIPWIPFWVVQTALMSQFADL